MFESRFRMEDERMDAFAKGEHYGNNFMYAGLFYSYYQRYMDSIANFFHKLVRKEDVKVAFEKFLYEDKPVEGPAKYSIGKLQGWLKPWGIFKNTQTASFPRFAPNSKFNVLELKVSPSSEMGEKAGLVFLKIRGYEDMEFGKEVEWRAKKDLMDEWIRLSESEAVREYLKEVREVYNLLEDALPRDYYRPPTSRIAYYLFPIELRSFGGSVIVSKASLYKRREETRKELWKEILKEFESTEDNKRAKKDLEFALEEKGKKLDYLEKLLEKALDQDHLNTLRRDWKEFLRKCLKGESDKLSAVFVGKVPEKNPPWVSFGTYHIPSVELELYVFAEEGFELEVNGKTYKAEDIVEILNREFEFLNFRRFLGNAKIKLVGSVKLLDELFGKNGALEIIKGYNLEERTLKNKDSVDLVYSLAYFSARLSNLIAQIKDGKLKNKFVGILILLNTEFEEGDRYALWDVVSFIYDYFGVPVQTITKRSLRSIFDKDKKSGTIKNLAISLYKDSKVLEVEFDGFDLPKEAVVYAVVEKPSPRFFYRRGEIDGGSRHYLYEVYKISIKEKRAKIELEKKYFELHGMRELGIESFIEEKKNYQNTKFCFITTLRDSKLGELYTKLSTPEEEHKFLLIRYDELKTAYFSDKSRQDCYIVYTQEMRKLFERLGIPIEKDVTAIALKPAHPPSMKEDMYHPSLQLFFTERVGWERDDVYSERKNLFIFTVLALSMYESESYMTPFSKLSLWTKERNYYLTIRRNYKEYAFPLKSVLYEMLMFVQERPGGKES